MNDKMLNKINLKSQNDASIEIYNMSHLVELILKVVSQQKNYIFFLLCFECSQSRSIVHLFALSMIIDFLS